MFTVGHKRDRVTISKQYFEIFQRNPDEFLRRFTTVNETWIHYFTPETKEQSKQWTSPGEPAPKKAKTVKSAGKVMATVFWDARRIIHIDLPSKQIINGDYLYRYLYRRSLIGPFQHFKEKTSPFGEEENTLSSRQCTNSHVPGQISLLHSAYSPDLAPCDYFLFPNLKKWFGGKRFIIREQLIHSGSPKQRLILKGWTNHIIRMA